jgi:hypothetical protein
MANRYQESLTVANQITALLSRRHQRMKPKQMVELAFIERTTHATQSSLFLIAQQHIKQSTIVGCVCPICGYVPVALGAARSLEVADAA